MGRVRHRGGGGRKRYAFRESRLLGKGGGEEGLESHSPFFVFPPYIYISSGLPLPPNQTTRLDRKSVV